MNQKTMRFAVALRRVIGGRSMIRMSRGGPIALTALLGLAASVAVALLSLSWERKVAALDFHSRAAAQIGVINTDLQDAVSVLDMLRAYFEANETPVNRAEFAHFITVLRSRSAGLRDTGWAPRISADQRDGFERAVRAAGFPAFEIREKDPSGRLVRAGERAEYYPILYVDPLEQNRVVLGFDLASEPIRRDAVARAIRSGQAAATPPIPLLTVPRPRGGVMSFVPMYRGGAREAAGLVFGAFDISAMVANVLATRRNAVDMALFLFDPAGPAGDRRIDWRAGRAWVGPDPDEAALRGRMHWEGALDLIDQHWGALILPPANLAPSVWSPFALLPAGIGVLLTGMVMAFLAISLRRNIRLEQLSSSLARTTRDLQMQSETILHMANHDPLTGLLNRRGFAEALKRETGRAARGGPACAVLLIDLDRFKPINDTHGHDVGDQVLCEVAQRLRAMLRAQDTVTRLGGDEFAAIMGCPDPAEDPSVLARRLIEEISRPIKVEAAVLQVGASIGIALCPQHAADPEAVLNAADKAMYLSKRNGRNMSSLFTPELAGPAERVPQAALTAG